MNVKFVIKTTRCLLTILTLCLFVVPTSFAKKSGNGGGKPPPEPPPDPPPVAESCAGYSSAFPAFAYAKKITNRKGSMTGFDVYLSNADADCSILVYSPSATSPTINLSYRQVGDDGVIAWDQGARVDRKGNLVTPSTLNIIRVHTSGKEVTSASASTVATTGSSSVSYSYIDISRDASKIAFATSDGNGTADISEVDIASCSSNCSVSAIYNRATSLIRGLSYGAGNRLYFTLSEHSNASTIYAAQDLVAFIENNNGSWGNFSVVTAEDNGYYPDSTSFLRPAVATADLGNGLTEVVAFESSATKSIEIIDVGSCNSAVIGDCISSDDSSQVKSVANAAFPSFDNVTSANSLILRDYTSDTILEHDLITGYEIVLVLDAFAADAGN